jgi:hypothetical protein
MLPRAIPSRASLISRHRVVRRDAGSRRAVAKTIGGVTLVARISPQVLLAAALMPLVGACTDRLPPPPAASPASGIAAGVLTNRVWIKTRPERGVGSMLIFLSDGTLVQDSCWETYRLSRWRADGADALRWQEDTAEIGATVVKSTETELTLLLNLTGGPETASYAAATAPYVCPDLPR